MNRICIMFEFEQILDIQGFKTEQEMTSFLIFANKTVNNTAVYLGGIVFDSVTRENQFTEQISYKIRLSSFPRHGRGTGNLNPAKQDKEWFTEFMFPLYQVLGPRDNSSKCGSVPGKTKMCHNSLHRRYCKHITCTFCRVFYLRNKESMWKVTGNNFDQGMIKSKKAQRAV